MPVIYVMGIQWGDEGKAKVLDSICSDAGYVVRFQGGANAGHTTVVDGVKYKFHLVPSGIITPGAVCVVANGVAIELPQILKEIDALREAGHAITPDNLKVSNRASVVMPYHKDLDGIEEELLGAKKLGTTKRGIGPTYADKHGYKGFRLCDLAHKDSFRKRLKARIEVINRLVTSVYGREPYDPAAMADEVLEQYERIAPFVADTVTILQDASDRGEKIILEGAQGALLDVDFGVYPYTTATSTTLGQCSGTGLSPQKISFGIGVMKAYTSRVGGGPFPTELKNETGDRIRDRGGEYGTTTGRPRRIGWMDIVALRYAARLTGIKYIALNHLDTIGAEPFIGVSTAYRDRRSGEKINAFPASFEDLSEMEPIIEKYPGWTDTDVTGCTSFDELPENAKNYVARIEELIGLPIAVVSVGPGREQTIHRLPLVE